jgi:hypothetical protein
VEFSIEHTDELLDAIALGSDDRPLLLAAGAIVEPAARALDAIRAAAAIDVFPHEVFISYDERRPDCPAAFTTAPPS